MGLELEGLEHAGPVFVNCSGCLPKGFVVRLIIILTRDAAELQGDEVKIPNNKVAKLTLSNPDPTT